MATVTRLEQASRSTNLMTAWIEAPDLPLKVGKSYILTLQFDHSGLSEAEFHDGPILTEWVASSDRLRLAPLDHHVSVTESVQKPAKLWTARMTEALGRDAGSIQFRLRVTPQDAGCTRISVVILVRPEDPEVGPSEPFERFDVDLPSVS